jgi:HlyD family secretion protein
VRSAPSRIYEVKSEIEIADQGALSLIPEGYLVTEEDVKDGKVLVELDEHRQSKTRIQNHEIEFQTTVSNYIDADQKAARSRKSENQSLVRATKEAGTFALMDFEKYLGRDRHHQAILHDAGLPHARRPPLDKYVVMRDAQASHAPSIPQSPTPRPQPLADRAQVTGAPAAKPAKSPPSPRRQ